MEELSSNGIQTFRSGHTRSGNSVAQAVNRLRSIFRVPHPERLSRRVGIFSVRGRLQSLRDNFDSLAARPQPCRKRTEKHTSFRALHPREVFAFSDHCPLITGHFQASAALYSHPYPSSFPCCAASTSEATTKSKWTRSVRSTNP